MLKGTYTQLRTIARQNGHRMRAFPNPNDDGRCCACADCDAQIYEFTWPTATAQGSQRLQERCPGPREEVCQRRPACAP